jgi:hypothetical protein
MLNLRIPPKTPEELYKFFTGISNLPVKSHVAYVNSIPYVRENWVVHIFLSESNRYYCWFRHTESDPAKWYKVYAQTQDN